MKKVSSNNLFFSFKSFFTEPWHPFYIYHVEDLSQQHKDVD